MTIAAFLDTTVFKLSATALRRYIGNAETFQWGPIEVSGLVYSEHFWNPNLAIQNPELREEADLLPAVAALGITGRVRFVISDEARYERWGLPNLDTETGMFYGAVVETIESPIRHSRVIGGLGVDGRAAQLAFLESIAHPRFLELQKATGAYQGKRAPNRNQLLDAFHLWCAEEARCEFFLTLDFKLIRVVESSRRRLGVRLVRPSQLLRELSER